MNILLTGATGFLGKQLGTQIKRQGVHALISVVRRSGSSGFGCEVLIRSIDVNTDWSRAFFDQPQVVIHSAARAHIMKDTVPAPLVEYRKVNVEGTITLALQAAKSGVGRFIYISSIKVIGEQTSLGKPFTPDDLPMPADHYGVSKLEAENALLDIASETGMEIVIIRPPLIYGPGVKGNFASIIKLVEMGLPLPLGSIHNKRSLVALDNLVDLIIKCIDHPAAANQVLHASDGQDVSTTELLRCLGRAMDKPVRLISMPAGMLKFGAALLGKKIVAQRLLGSLQVDISKTRNLLSWDPPLDMDEGLSRCFDSGLKS